MQSLRDKLLKAGVVTEEQAKKAEAQKAEARARNEARPRTDRPAPHRADASPIPKLPPLPDPSNKEWQRHASKKQLEVDRQLRELVRDAEVKLEPGPQAFYFVTRKNRLRRLELSKEQAEKLEKGELAVVERPEAAQIEHSLVPAQIADRLLSLSPKAVRFLNRPDKPVGFLSDDDLATRQAAEASGTAKDEEEPEPSGEGQAEV